MTAPTDITFNAGTKITSAWLNGVNDHVNNQETSAHSALNLSYGSQTIESALNERLPEIGTYVLLRAYTGPVTAFMVRGVANIFDGGFGVFRVDSSDTTSTDNDGTVLVDASERRWKRDYTGEISARWFGAKGDGVTDDTTAIKAAGAAALAAPILTVGNTWTSRAYAPMIKLPRGTYMVKGDRIFGSQLADGDVTAGERLRYEIDGCGSVIVWDIESATDRLFNFDYLLESPRIRNLTIFVINSTKTISIGGDVFHYNSFTSGGTSYAGPSGGLYESVFVNLGSYDGFGTRPAHVFKSMGTNMSDQTLVLKCGFNYFQKLFYCENSQSVNWTFSACGIYGGGGANAVYFDFTEMDDNFNVENCSFSINSGETLLKNRSELSGGVYTQTGNFNFNFSNNRIELYGSAGTEWNLCDINYGRFNFRNTNLRLGGSAGNVKTVVSAYGAANLNFDGIAFNPVKFRFPVLTSEATTGTANAFGALLRNCQIQSTATEYFFWDGTTEYALKDALIGSAGFARHVRFESLTYLNQNGIHDFDLALPLNGVAAPPRLTRSRAFSTYGVAIGNTYRLPPYQQIKRITISMLGAITSTVNAFRIYFGDISLGNYVDVANHRPETYVKQNFTIFEGTAAVFNADLTKQSITVFALQGTTETSGVGSQITVEYEPLDCKALGITTNADTIKVNRNVRAMVGTTAIRPTVDRYTGQQYWDTTLAKPIWWNGANWVDATGATV